MKKPPENAVTAQFAREEAAMVYGSYKEAGYQTNPTVLKAGGALMPSNASVSEAFAIADADFEVERVPLFHKGEDHFVGVDSHRLIVRSDTGVQLGVVGKGYVPVQNSNLQNLFEYLHENTSIDNILLLRGGAKVFVTARINAEAEVVDGDPVRRYLHAFNSHDGSGSFGVFFSDIRLRCANQLSYLTGRAASEAKRSGKGLICRHTKSVTAFAESLPALVDIERQSFYQDIKELQQLTKLVVTPEIARKVLEATYAKELSGKIRDKETKEMRKRDLTDLRAYSNIRSFFRGSEGIGIQGKRGIEGTAYGLFNAITQHETHSACRLHDPAAAARVQLESLWGGMGAKRIETARNVLMEMAV